MTIVKEDTTILPRWSEGTIRLLDIAPIGPGQPQPREGLPISLAYCDLVMRPDQTFADVNGGVFQGMLQKVPGERGGSDFVVEDRLFNAVFPHNQALPLCLAGYNVSFLHRLLGAPWGERPHHLCLHKLARIYNLGKSSDYSLAEIVEYLQPSCPTSPSCREPFEYAGSAFCCPHTTAPNVRTIRESRGVANDGRPRLP